MGNSTGARWRYVVRVDFLSAGDPFASETYTIEAPNLRAARIGGLHRSEDSVYDDPRIPDFARIVTARREQAS